MLTGRQIRQVRNLLGWNRAKFSHDVLLSQVSVEAVESSHGPAWLTDEQEANIRRACEGAGIRFETDADGQPTAVMVGSTK